MTYKELKNAIDGIGLPANYYKWPEKNVPALPYLLFYYPNRNDFVADNKNYAHVTELIIELYTDNKDFGTEASVEAFLEANELVYTKAEQYIEDEKMYEVAYITEVNIQ